jgi:integral membrane sensor domain MASE1
MVLSLKTHVVGKAALFFVASTLAVCFPLVLGRVLWPHGLSAGAEFIFWPATGVNVAFVLAWGWRYAPVILLDVFPAVVLLGEPWGKSILGAGGNCIEALLAYAIIQHGGKFSGRFDQMRPVLALLAAALVAPMTASLVVPAYLVLTGTFHPTDFLAAVGNWNLANGTAMLVLAPFVLALRGGRWTFPRHPREAPVWLAAVVLVGAAAFNEVFLNRGLNFAFLTFPLVILVAVRFGPEETAATLLLAMASIYIDLARHAPMLKPADAPAVIWFVQAFTWVLAATGLVVAALVAERRRAERQALAEQGRTLEASLREERARLDALRYQINPHFLFNALNSIRAEMPLSLPAPRDMLTGLADYLRSTLDHPGGDTVALREEVRSVESYLGIEKNRFGERLRLAIEIDPAAREIPVPVFLLQPLVENAIRHGLEASKQPCDLRIAAKIDSSRLKIEVSNSGAWKEESGRKGLGLENIRRRLDLLYGPAAGFVRLPEEGRVCFRIELPLAVPRNPHALPDR